MATTTHFSLVDVRVNVKYLLLHRNEITVINMRVLIWQIFTRNKFERLDLRLNPLRCRCDSFRNDLYKFNLKFKGCDYVDCFACNWLKRNFFEYDDKGMPVDGGLFII